MPTLMGVGVLIMSIVTVRNSHISSISQTVSDYQGGGVITPERIYNWIRQFDEENQETILAEMDQILRKFYVTKAEAVTYLGELFEDEEIFEDFEDNYEKIEFLNIQTRGQSQKELLELLDEVLLEKYGICTEECGSEDSELTTYIYIDDCFFTGNRVYRDIEGWIGRAKKNTTLHIIFFGLHEQNVRYQMQRIKKLLATKNIDLQLWCFKKILMDNWAKGKYECCWPVYHEGIQLVDDYVAFLDEQRKKDWKSFSFFRDADKPYVETLFSSKEARNIVEKAFLIKGIEIFNLSESPNLSMKPMGYNFNVNLGFGSMFVTYRNIANNCPSVLWWGDLEKEYPINQWLPLFPRKTNTNNFW